MKVRTLRAKLWRLGCSPIRRRGSHEIWHTPARAMLVLKINHLGAEVSRAVLSSCRRTLAAEGRTLEGDAASLRDGVPAARTVLLEERVKRRWGAWRSE